MAEALVKPYLDLRRATAARDRGLREKVMSLEDAAKLVKDGDHVRALTCPFTGEPLLLLPALNPDVALIHVQRADPFGNAQLDGLQFLDIDLAMAANRVILTTERIVSNEQIRRTPHLTRIPFFTVEAVVEVPF